MKLYRSLALLTSVLMLATLVGCSCNPCSPSVASEDPAPAANELPVQPSPEVEKNLPVSPTTASSVPEDSAAPEAVARIQITDAEGKMAVYALNDSSAADDLRVQLPLSADLEDFSTNEKIFYPLEKLNTEGTPIANGMAGCLGYYAPWGDVVLFYDTFARNDSLFELGKIESGFEDLASFTGPVRVEEISGAK